MSRFRSRRRFRRSLPVGMALVFLLLMAPAAAGVRSAVNDTAGPSVAEAPHSPVTVSLTFDDGTVDQNQVGPMLAAHGMHGTFYVNSGRLGEQGYLSAAQLGALEAAGNEVGGHTVSHADLPTLSADEATRQVCDDRVSLLNAGFQVRDFAYPFGNQNATVARIAAQCGYNSARGVGGVVAPGACQGCPYAERVPPVNTYDITTPGSVRMNTSLADMQNSVLQAEQHDGGWLVLVFHRVCSGCDVYSVPADQLEMLLAWLADRAAGGTRVRTVAEVMGGAVKPGVSGPRPSTPGTATNALANPSLETDADHNGLPDCWSRTGYGVNTASWSRTDDAHAGEAADRVTISAFTDGDRRLVSSQDLGACAPDVLPGHTYRFTGWYQGSGSVRMVAYYRTSSGGWQYFHQGPFLPATTGGYQQASWVTPPVPAGASGLSVGFTLRSTGFVTGDDFSLRDTDQTPPTVVMTSPYNGTAVAGRVMLRADANDVSGVDHVDFLVRGQVVCADREAPYACDWDSRTGPDDMVGVTARAVDTAGNEALSDAFSYIVTNSVVPDSSPPNVAVTGPAVGAVLRGEVTLNAAASDNDEVSQVMFFVNGAQVGSRGAAPYAVSWDSATVGDGPVKITAKAIDRWGNEATSAVIDARVANDLTPPTSSIKCNQTTCTLWYPNDLTVNLSATDVGAGVAGIFYTLDDSDPSDTHGTRYTGPFAVAAPSTLKWRAYDRSGNAEDIHAQEFRFDRVPPTGEIVEPISSAQVTGSVYLRTNAADNVAVARVWFSVDGKPLGSRIVSPFQWKWDTTGVPPGNHLLTVVISDSAGNLTKPPAVPIELR